MELNLMLIGGMLIATAIVGWFISIDERKEERKRQRMTRDIWGRV